MSISDALKQRRHKELFACLRVIDSCLAAYYAGAQHMYRPLAGQLRILLCDKPALLSRVFPNLKLNALRPIEWVDPNGATVFDGLQLRLATERPPGEEYRLARMPFLVVEFENGLQIADLQWQPSGPLLPLEEWMDQRLTLFPSELSLREMVRSVADKGGGAHVDDDINEALRAMQSTAPAQVGVHVLFTVAIGRFAQAFGVRYAQLVERFGLRGRLQDVVVDPEHPSAKNAAKVSEELLAAGRPEYVLTVWNRRR
jgi:hypothetical protein